MINLQAMFLDEKKNYFSGIGKHASNNILSALTYDDLALHLENKNTDILRKKASLTERQAMTLFAGYATYRPLFEVARYLDGNGITQPIAPKVFRLWGPLCLEKIIKNPYRLLAFTAWEEVDRLGLNCGPKFHTCRLVAAIQNCMYLDCEEGKHTFIHVDDLFKKVQVLIGCNRRLFDKGLQQAILTHTVVEYMGHLQVPCVHHFERAIEQFLSRNTPPALSESCVNSFLNTTKYATLTGEQRVAVKFALLNRYSAYNGRGGRGKTYTLLSIADGAEILLHKKIILAAVSTKAAKKMEMNTGRPAITIAKLVLSEKKELANSLIAIDEGSMLSLSDAYHLLKKLPSTANIVFIGDENQIPSIHAGRFFYDILNNNAVQHVELTINKRQDSKTDKQLDLILAGEFPLLDEYHSESESGLYRISAKNIKDAQAKAVDLYLWLSSKSEEAQIISPLKRYPGGCIEINANVHIKKYGTKEYCKGTPVIWTKNCRVDWGVRLTNGSFGTVEDSENGSFLTVYFEQENQRVGLTQDEVFNHLEMAYCLTVHRAQGSEWENVIIVLPKSDRMVTRNMIYTALSRCRHRAIIIYDAHSYVASRVKAAPAHLQRRSLLFMGTK